LAGLYFSLRNIKNLWESYPLKPLHVFLVCLPLGLFIISTTVMMLFFFTD
jgi:uncharacterized membrane protein